jgi:signal transduction histidine kinase
VRVEAAQEGAFWRIAVVDNGIGVPVEYRDRIFGIFERLDPGHSHRGTGIGLALCRRIVERYGGQIRVEAAPSGGSAFIFTLPARPDPDSG